MQKSIEKKSPHLEAAFDAWQKIVSPGDIVIDATAGGGFDSVKLATLALRKELGNLHIFDIQKDALLKTEKNLQQNFPEEIVQRIHLHEACHSTMATYVQPGSAKLIVFNLGYFPGGDKSITTMLHTTVQSVQTALTLLQTGGLLSITCYPGHLEGEKEEHALIQFAKMLDQQKYLVSFRSWINREKFPSLLCIYRIF